MKVLLVVILIILLILLTRLSAILTYGDSGASVLLRVYFVRITIYPRTKEKKQKKEKKEKDTGKTAGEKEDKRVERGGSIDKFKDMFGIIKRVLSIIRKRLLINDLTVRYTVSCDDAAKAAVYYGSACLAVQSLLRAFNSSLKIKKQDIKINVDFTGSGSKIFARGIISMAIWEIIYIAGSLLMDKSFKETVFTNSNSE